ncbi:MAG: DUF4416 family protein [Candidatus Omnitrophica bacterium]|nr:DUF4416 family protein [Candidatus Omnitrophota bacterium]
MTCMGKLSSPGTVKLISSFIYARKEDMEKALKAFSEKYGRTDLASGEMDFDFTDYYDREFGRPLKRILVSCEALVPVEGIETVKLASNSIEDSLSRNGKRTVNVDPGYVTEAKLVLLTTKDYAHRIHIRRGIFAECTLYYRNEKFRSWPWTYPDYASDGIKDFLAGVREKYVAQIKGGK